MRQKIIPTIPSPCFVIEETLLRKNLEIIRYVADKSGAEIILAFKGFAMWGIFSIVREYFNGATASSLNEARLAYEEMKCKAHCYCPVIIPEEAEKLMEYCSHISFNSLSEFERYKDKAIQKGVSCGIRVNPEYSEVSTALYNPCSPHSRLGMTKQHFGDVLPAGIEGLHFHALCENDSYTLENTLKAFEQKFGHLIPRVKWVNMGGGHLMTKTGYDIEHLIKLIQNFRAKYGVHVILEPGAAFAWQTGFLVSTILDIVENNGVKTLMTDVSFSAHMPDCLEMPYRPAIRGASDPVQGKETFRIGGTSCLSGDFMHDYSFENEPKVGDHLIFEDMIHYTMVKTTMFNGVKHPSIGMITKENEFRLLREFGYEDYKNRLS